MARDKHTKSGLGNAPKRRTISGVPMERKKIVTKRGLVAPSPHDPERLEEFVPESDRRGRRESGVAPKGTSAADADRREENEQRLAALSEEGEVAQTYDPADKKTDPRGMSGPPPLNQMEMEESALPEDIDPASVRSFARDSVRSLDRDEARDVTTDPLGQSRPEMDEDSVEPVSRRFAAHEDLTPTEGTDIGGVDEREARSRFRTAPGGGRNRVSGGREKAKAYVSPVTVKPGTGDTPPTGPVKVHEVVASAVRAYETEPSLLKRRQSSLPPAPHDDRQLYYLFGGLAMGCLSAALVVWVALRSTAPPDPSDAAPATSAASAPTEGKQEAPDPAHERADVSDVGQEPNDAKPEAAQGEAAQGEAAQGEAAQGEAAQGEPAPDKAPPAPAMDPSTKQAAPRPAKPSSSQEASSPKSASPKPSPLPEPAQDSPSSEPSNDLWLE